VNSGKAAERRKDGMPVGTLFQLGLSGNPAGRPQGHFSIRKIALNLVMKAVAGGDLAAIWDVRDTIDGKPTQALNLGGQETTRLRSTAS
jgi:hypothetical protein